MKNSLGIMSTLLSATMLFSGCSAVEAKELAAPTQVKNLSELIVKDVNKVGTTLYDKMQTEGENTFISPVSIYLAYGMLYNGTANESAQELQAAFGYDADVATHNGNSKYLMNYITKGRDGLTIELANSVWVDAAFEKALKPAFVSYNKEHFGADVSALDFAAPQSVQTINNWVSDNTGGMIDSILDKLTPADRLVLINCVYFNAQWQVPFDADKTKEGTFNGPNQPQTVDYMERAGAFSYFETDVLQAVSLPYADGKTSLLVMLPKAETNPLATVNPFEEATYSAIRAGLSEADVRLTLPKVDLSYSDDGTLRNALEQAGVQSIFSPAKADLTGIADSKDPLYVSDTRHKTALKIDEEGTEAAAVTSIGIRAAGIMPQEPKYIEMHVNRPFYTAIVDNETGMMLFCGSITQPTQ